MVEQRKFSFPFLFPSFNRGMDPETTRLEKMITASLRKSGRRPGEMDQLGVEDF